MKAEIIAIIKERECILTEVTEKSNLYADLGFDSLSFIDLLMELESVYSINFDIMEMEGCLEVGRLIAVAEAKVKGRAK